MLIDIDIISGQFKKFLAKDELIQPEQLTQVQFFHFIS